MVGDGAPELPAGESAHGGDVSSEGKSRSDQAERPRVKEPFSPLLPFRSNFVTINGSALHYLDEGSGPVVLLLHGNPTWCFYYRNLIRELRGHFRVIAPDYLGCGLSDRPRDEQFRAIDRVAQIEALVQSLKIDRLSIVAHDWGGSIGTAFAVRHNAMVDRIVYLNTTLDAVQELPLIIKTAATSYIGRFLTEITPLFVKITTSFGVRRPLPRTVRQAYLHPYRRRALRRAIWNFVRDIPFSPDHPTSRDLGETVASVSSLRSVPVRIVWGLKDPCFHRGILEKFSAHFPHATVRTIPDASHLVLEDAPEIVCREVKEFLMEGSPRLVRKLSRDEANPLVSSFFERADAAPERDAVIAVSYHGAVRRYAGTSYRQLADTVRRYQRGLLDLGLGRGDRVLFLVPPGSEFIALTYATMACGAIPVFVDPGIGRAQLERCIEASRCDALISVPKAGILKLRCPSLRTLKFHLTVGKGWFPLCRGDATVQSFEKFSSSALDLVQGEDTGFIAFTSGATGTPKGVVFTREMLTAQHELFTEGLDIRDGDRDLPLLPIFSLFDVAYGITAVFPPLNPGRPLDLDPAQLVEVITELSITSSFGSPTLWKKIADHCRSASRTLPGIRQVLIAGAPVSDEVAMSVQEILPNGRAVIPYGATEALPVTVLSAEERRTGTAVPALTGEQGVPVGRPLNGVELAVIAPGGDVRSMSGATRLPPRTIGEILVRGPQVSPRYLNNDEANRRSKLEDGNGFWHRMGDVGYCSEEGAFFFCGRSAHVVHTDARAYYPVPIERIFNTHPRVQRSALVSVVIDGRRAPGIVVEPRAEYFPQTEEARATFEIELQMLAVSDPICSGISQFFFHPSFPVDARHNAKIFRDKLGQWATDQVRRSARMTP